MNRMRTLLLEKNTILAVPASLNDTIPKREGGNRMLRLNFFALTLTIAVKQPQSVQRRYEDEQRIKALREKVIDRRVGYSCYFR